MRFKNLITVLALGTSLFAAESVVQWPQFRGPGGTGRNREEWTRPPTSRRCGRIMTSSMSERTFTLDEAQSLLPVLESLLRTAIAGEELIEDVEGEMQAVNHRISLNGGTSVDIVPLARRKAERVKAEQRVRDALAEIDSIGVQVKDIDIGLLDFPCTVEGRTVLLCWKLGEKSITQWHGVEEGFAGRKPIDERIAKGKRTN